MRIILLIDMDYFYVACEELRRPEIKDRPSIVGADPKGGSGRGVVMTCSYAARRYGIRSGMPISMAYKIKSDAIYLPVDFDYYEEISKKVMAVIKEFADKFEQVSIDEAYIDVSKEVSAYEEALEYARVIKGEIRKRLGLPCSIGISTTKLLAKMACDKAKPDGIKLVKEEEAKSFMGQMEVGELHGVGGKTSERLKALGYNTIGELSKADPQELKENFGMFGIELHKYANGIDESGVVENYEIKSIGREKTFYTDTTDSAEIIKAIGELSNGVMSEVEMKGFAFKTVTLKLRYADFTEHLKSRSIKSSNSVGDIANVAGELYFKSADRTRKIRKIGVRVSGLTKSKGQKRIGDYS